MSSGSSSKCSTLHADCACTVQRSPTRRSGLLDSRAIHARRPPSTNAASPTRGSPLAIGSAKPTNSAQHGSIRASSARARERRRRREQRDRRRGRHRRNDRVERFVDRGSDAVDIDDAAASSVARRRARPSTRPTSPSRRSARSSPSAICRRDRRHAGHADPSLRCDPRPAARPASSLATAPMLLRRDRPGLDDAGMAPRVDRGDERRVARREVLRAVIEAADLGAHGGDASAGDVASLEDRDGVSAIDETPRAGQARDAGTDDGDSHRRGPDRRGTARSDAGHRRADRTGPRRPAIDDTATRPRPASRGCTPSASGSRSSAPRAPPSRRRRTRSRRAASRRRAPAGSARGARASCVAPR